MGRLWSEHVIWTRGYIVAALADTPEKPQAAARLLKNQEDIGAAIVPYYGQDAGSRLTDLLKQHIQIAVDLIDAARAGHEEGVRTADERWDHNAAEIAGFLSGANPHWPQADVLDLLMQHLELTRGEVRARMQKRHAAEVETFDQILTEILTVADTLSDGIVRQFPEKF
jgi:hypothetical protein